MSTVTTAIDTDASTLVIMLHAYIGRGQSLSPLAELVAQQWPDAYIHAPDLDLDMLSTANPNEIVISLLGQVDDLVKRRAEAGIPIKRIILVGHSIGGLLARKLYVIACGETVEATFEPLYRTHCAAGELVPRRPWARLVSRIVLLAGINRGWRISHHLSIATAIRFGAGSFLGHLWELFHRPLVIFTCRRGAEFITNLRIQWLYMQRAAGQAAGGGKCALTVQLLGSRDDMVAPEDNVDLVSGGQFIYLDVPFSGHKDVIEVKDAQHGQGRADAFKLALGGSLDALQRAAVVPADERFSEPDEKVRRVLFVIHGIRDVGYWTHKIARRVKHMVASNMSEWATETSSYGYFPMLAFLFPWSRRQKVEWLMDQYTEAVARYPNATFSFVGHSNGTFLLAKALELYPACRFDHVVFAGSVVRKNYDWSQYLPKPPGLQTKPPRVKAVLNLVANADAVVAVFPKLLQDLKLQELGSAGHDGFEPVAQGITQRYVEGGHGAAIQEQFWGAIAKFIVTGQVDASLNPQKMKHERLARLFGPYPRNLLAWTLIIAIIAALWIGIDLSLRSLGLAPSTYGFIKGLAAAAYAYLLWMVVTRV